MRVDVTSSSIAAWHANNLNLTSCDDDYGEGLERFNVNGSWDDFVVGLRLDGSLYVNSPEATPFNVTEGRCRPVELTNRYVNALTPEKVWAGWNGRNLEITLGDSYASFGRGLVLSLRKSDELGTDTTARGVRVNLRTERVGASLIAGVTNINNVDEASGRFEPDPNDLVIGATADVRVWESVRVGANVSTFMFREPVSSFTLPGQDETYQEKWILAGPKIEAPRLTPWLGVYLEGVGQKRIHVDGTSQTGYGLYGSATAYLGPLTLLLEGKAYGDLETVQPKFDSLDFQTVQYTALPTLERVNQLLINPQRNIYGGRFRADYALTPEIGLYANLGIFRDFEGYQDPVSLETLPGTIVDPYVGANVRVGLMQLTAITGYRWVAVHSGTVEHDGHLDVDVVQGLGGGSSVEAHLTNVERRHVTAFSDASLEYWREGTLQLGFRKRPWFALGAIIDYTTEVGQPAVWYPGGTAEWDFTEASNLRLFVGQSRGGLRCVSGVCRIFPPFSGVKGTLTVRL